MGTEQKNRDVPMKVTGETVYSIDVRVPGMKWAAVKSCPVYGGDVKSYDFDAVRNMPGVRSCSPFPDPRSEAHARPRVQRRRGGDRGSLAPGEGRRSSDADRVERSRRATPRSTRGTCTRRCSPRSTSPAQCASTSATSTPRSRARTRSSRRRTRLRICRARGWSPATRPCSSRTTASTSGSATRARRRRASAPRRSRASRKPNVYLHMCHLGGGFGRNGNGPQAEQAIMIANANRGTPIHLLWTREEDFIGTTYRAMGVARLTRRARRGRLAARARGAHRDAEGRLRPRCVVRRRVALLRAELSFLATTRRISTCRSARGAASARPRTSSIARAS